MLPFTISVNTPAANPKGTLSILTAWLQIHWFSATVAINQMTEGKQNHLSETFTTFSQDFITVGAAKDVCCVAVDDPEI